ncbi:hypothetical protein LY39_00715 [Roseinatronobacter bogoriensis subsp. barguzinensis]|nr:hypothetical protein LY39_00715 [Rhodobaca barguzinensis]TDY74213.1 hypothetical protein EV660_101249 [Rhodobaca bogoriensis DSM 18756]
MHCRNLRQTRQARHDPFGAAPLNPDHHQSAHGCIGHVAPRDGGKSQNFALLLQARKPRAHGGTADPKSIRQRHDGGAAIAPQFCNQTLVDNVHIGKPS